MSFKTYEEMNERKQSHS